MGWRTWNSYEEEAERQLRELPWRERYRWRSILALALVAITAAIAVWLQA